MKDHFIITLRVYDRIYRLKINRKDEKKYRDAAVAIEKKTTQYRNYFAGSTSNQLLEQDYLTMTTIQALSETEALEEDNKQFEKRIQYFIDTVDEYLRSSK